MTAIWMLIGLVVGAVAGAAVASVVARARWSERLEAERRLAGEQLARAEEVQASLGDTIEAAAARAVRGNSEAFLALAGEKLAPFDDKLRSFEQQLRDLERAREGAYGSLREQVRGLLEAQEMLRRETGKLVNALHKPGVRGRWGELTLRRVVELAGMVDHCDFAEQVTVEGDDGRLRPDLVVHLPGPVQVPVDAKVPLDSYLAAAEATDEAARRGHLVEHARRMREHMLALAKKGYWEQFAVAPDFVVMFVPGEPFVAAALEHRADLFEEGLQKRVILATPATLIALLRAVAHGWRQETIAESAQQISDLGRDLHKRIATLAGHYAMLGKRLGGAVEAYNQTVGSLERTVLPQARKFEDLGAGSAGTIDTLEPIDTTVRRLTAPELGPEASSRVVELERGSEAASA